MLLRLKRKVMEHDTQNDRKCLTDDLRYFGQKS